SSPALHSGSRPSSVSTECGRDRSGNIPHASLILLEELSPFDIGNFAHKIRMSSLDGQHLESPGSIGLGGLFTALSTSPHGEFHPARPEARKLIVKLRPGGMTARAENLL